MTSLDPVEIKRVKLHPVKCPKCKANLFVGVSCQFKRNSLPTTTPGPERTCLPPCYSLGIFPAFFNPNEEVEHCLKL